jgi:hypothetical protein
MDPGQGGIWIAFAGPNDRGPDGNVILGHGGVTTDGELIVGGQAVIGNDAEAQSGFGPGHTIGSVVLHELCHAMNLAHVEVQSELMSPYVNSLTPPLFGPGEEMGLWLVGVGRGARS